MSAIEQNYLFLPHESFMSDVTVVITSCNRLDLLYRTLASFIEFNTYPVHKIIIIDDSGVPNVLEKLKGVNDLFVCVENEINLGQILSIDKAYAMVETDYVFHLEDDWEFFASGFIEESKAMLERRPNCINHWIRRPNDTNGHPHRQGILRLNHKGTWHGFTFNPTLKRMSDYHKIGSYGKYTTFDRLNGWRSEAKIGDVYRRLGYVATIGTKGYVKHIGDNRHVIV
jgi:GT2 family glycosyltransferase